MQDVNDNPTSLNTDGDGKTPQGLATADRKGVNRRKFLLAGAAAPVVMTLANRPAFALTNCDPCGFVQLQTSLNPSAQVRSAACGGSTPLYWRSTPGAWVETNYRAGRPIIIESQGKNADAKGKASVDTAVVDSEESTSLLLSLASQGMGGADIGQILGQEIQWVGGTLFHEVFPGARMGARTMMQVLWDYPDSLAAQAAAAVLNATDARRSRYGVDVRVVIDMYAQVEARGYFTTSTGSRMPEEMVLAFLMNTYG
jgi:hypothetical protein